MGALQMKNKQENYSNEVGIEAKLMEFTRENSIQYNAIQCK